MTSADDAVAARGRGPHPDLVGSAAHVFVDDLDHPTATVHDVHHLVRVLRLRAGEPVTASDGRGSWRVCRIDAVGGLEVAGEVHTEPPPSCRVGIGFGIPKGDRPEWIVQKLTEVGADVIIPLHTDRGIVRWDGERAARHLERLRRVAREAAGQSRRTRLPVIEPVTDLRSFLGRSDVGLATLDGPDDDQWPSTILIGPEGGWSAAERDGFTRGVRLGATVLRTETAAVVACTQLIHRPGGGPQAPLVVT